MELEKPYSRILIYTKTRRILKIAAVLQDVSIIELVHRLATAELERVKGGDGTKDAAQ